MTTQARFATMLIIAALIVGTFFRAQVGFAMLVGMSMSQAFVASIVFSLAVAAGIAFGVMRDRPTRSETAAS